MLNILYKKRFSTTLCHKKTEYLNKRYKVLFTVLSRYGDSITAFVIIDEFIKEKKIKNSTLITSKQLLPYAIRLVNADNIRYFNKKSIFSLLSNLIFIKKSNFEIGFNPHSFGDESAYLISFCKNFSIFKQNSETGNLYNKNRVYLGLEKKFIFDLPTPPSIVKSILICPETTEARKAFGREELKILIKQLQSRFDNPSITLAISSKKSKYFLEGFHYHFFKKSKASSEIFLELMQNSDLVVSVDSGPLHLAKALGKKTIAFFSCTAPEIIIDNFTHIIPIRSNKLSQIQCENKGCKNPRCLNELFEKDIFDHIYKPKIEPIAYIKKGCPYDGDRDDVSFVEL